MGLPVWARWIRSRGATKQVAGELDVPVNVGGQLIRPGDIIVLDADGVAVVASERADAVLEASLERERKERDKRAQLAGRRALLRARRPARRRREGGAQLE